VTQVSERRPGLWNIANALTALRLALVPPFVWLMVGGGGSNARLLAFGAFLLAALTDKVDGELARRRALITNFGKIADPVADKVLVGAALICLSSLNELPWWVTALILVRELGVTAVRFVVIRYGVIAASPGGKAKTLLQTVAIALYLLPLAGAARLAAEVIMGAAVVLTVGTGIDYVVRAVRLRRASAR
jgi:CDP-diacylglycerol--glycerol-3-phosphate 3-phosphatidyltransferase